MKDTTRIVFYLRLIGDSVAVWLFAVNEWLTDTQVDRITHHIEDELSDDGLIKDAIRKGLKSYATEKNLDYRISTCWELECDDINKMPQFDCDYIVNLTQWIVVK